ncbi:MAG: glycosyltransferase family 2 protein [Eubacteriales bacterium]|nr:glycosyltransferase family 2 protein [Eubacteriales bacterium]
MRSNTLYLVVPCYNEEEVLHKTAEVLSDKLLRLIAAGKASPKSRILFVNDGSKDKTWKIIYELTRKNEIFAGLSFSRNYGHQSAILAGMMAAREKADAVVTVDADLQQDIEALDQFLDCYQKGCEIVYGVRNDRDTDGFFKKMTAGAFYRLMHLLGCRTITNHADYRLMSKKALNALAEFKETNLFLRGLIPTMGFASDIVYFDVKEREAGQSKYTLKKMLTLAVDGITSMSTRPLQLIVVLGFLTFLFSICLFISCIVDWANGQVVAGWTTTVASTCLIGGMTLLSQGIIGEYIGKIYMESKGRPRYIVDSMILRDGGEEQTEVTDERTN